MSIKLSNEIIEIINNPKTKKVIATISKEGIPHVTYKGSLKVNEDGNLEFLELIESSITNRNMVNSIWYNKKVAINVLGEEGQNYSIIGSVQKCIISGKEFQKRYEEVISKSPEADLSSIWIITPEKIRDENIKVRLEEAKKENPLQLHLDKIAKIENEDKVNL